MKPYFFLLSFIIFGFTNGFSQEKLDGKTILKKAEDRLRGGDQVKTELTIDIVRPKWNRTMKLKSWAKGNDYSIILITGPARDKGTVFLKRKKEVWNFMPTFNKITKLPPSAMSQSWMGTDLSNDDLVRESSKVDDFEYQLGNDTTINGLSCYKIILTPKESANVIWGKMFVFIDKTDFIQLRSEMYDEDNKLVNILNASEIKTLSGIKMATKMEMIPIDKQGHKTIMTITNLDTSVQLTDAFFSKQNMKKIR